MTFHIYDQPSEGAPLWSSSKRAINVVAGHFSVVLGGEADAEALDTVWDAAPDRYYLGMSIGSQAELDGRQEVFPAAMAVRAVPGSTFQMRTGRVDEALVVAPGKSIAGEGKLVVTGPEGLHLLNKEGVVVSKAGDGNGNLRVEGAIAVEENMRIAGNGRVEGPIGTNGFDPLDGLPQGWGGGLHTWDVFAEGTIAVGSEGEIASYLNSAGDIFARENRWGDGDGPETDCENSGWIDSSTEGGYSDWYRCQDGWYVAGLRTDNAGGSNKQLDRIEVRCCRL